MYPGIVHKNPKPRLVTNVERRATSWVSRLKQHPLLLIDFLTASPAIAHPPRRAADSPVAVAVAAVARVKSVTAAARLATSHATAPTGMQRVVGMVVEIRAMVEEDLAEVRRRPGEYLSITTMTVFSEVPPFVRLSSYSCGGVGHLSRDCVQNTQGPKCYNCNGVVSIIQVYALVDQ